MPALHLVFKGANHGAAVPLTSTSSSRYNAYPHSVFRVQVPAGARRPRLELFYICSRPMLKTQLSKKSRGLSWIAWPMQCVTHIRVVQS